MTKKLKNLKICQLISRMVYVHCSHRGVEKCVNAYHPTKKRNKTNKTIPTSQTADGHGSDDRGPTGSENVRDGSIRAAEEDTKGSDEKEEDQNSHRG